MYANLEQEQVAMDHHHQFPRGPQPTEFHEVVHKIYAALGLWADIQRKGLSLQPTANIINYLTHEPLIRTATTTARHEGYYTVIHITQTLLALYDELEPKGLPLQSIRQLIHDLLGGPAIIAAIGGHLDPSKSPAYMLKH